MDRVSVSAPASTANLGVGFDTLSAPIKALVDRVEAWMEHDQHGVIMESVEGPYAEGIPITKNTAVAAAEAIARVSGWKGKPGIILRLWKGVPPGRGLGSSGASASAAVLAVARLLGVEPGLETLVRAAGEGEAVSAGVAHYDNVAASITGKLSLVADLHGSLIVRTLGDPPPLIVAVPQVDVPPSKTMVMRRVLPEMVELGVAVRQWQRLAALVHSIMVEDWRLAGKLMMSDEIVEPARAPHVPCYSEVKHAALDAGAYAVFISGAGPSIAVLPGRGDVELISSRVREAYFACGISVEIVVS